MNNQEFIKYIANRYGIDENTIETIVDIFAVALQEVIYSGQNVSIDEIGEFLTTSVPSANRALKKYSVTFKPALKLLQTDIL